MTITKAKYCTTCRSASSTLYRCRYNNQKIWIFLCASCLKKVKKDFWLDRFVIKIIKEGNMINPRGSMKKGGYNSAVNKPKIKNFKKIN